MGLPLIFTLVNSFIRRLDNFVAANFNLNHQFLLKNVATFKWRGVGGRTVAKTLQYDLPMVASSAPLVVASSIEELVTILHDTYNVKLICVCQTLLGSDPAFNTRVHALNKYVKLFLEAPPPPPPLCLVLGT